MSSKEFPLPRAKNTEVTRGGRDKAAMPGLGNMTLDATPWFLTTTEMAWHSTATRTWTSAPIPFNFEIADIFTGLRIAPVDSVANRFQVGTATDPDLFFVTGNLVPFASTSPTISGPTGIIRRTSATNAVNLNGGTAGMRLRVTLPPTTGAATTTDGAVYGILVIVPRS